MMLHRIVFLSAMALHTDAVAFATKPQAVRFMTVAACYTGVKHTALDEGAVFVDLALDLSIWKVKILIKESDKIVVTNRLTMHIVFVNLTSARMATRAHLDLALGVPRPASA